LPENNFMADSSTISPTGQSGPEAGGAGLSDATVGIDGLSALGGSIANAGIFDRTDIRDPKEMQQYKRDKILADNSGLRGLVNIAYGKLGLETSADDELKELSQASSDSDTREREEAWRLKGQTEHDQYGHDLRVLREAVAATGRSESQNEQASIDKTYQSEMSEADKLANENWAGAGFSSPRAQNEEVIQFKQNAQLLRQASESKLTNEDREGVFLNDNRLKALQLQASGDSTGARRQELQNQLIGEAVNVKFRHRREAAGRASGGAVAGSSSGLSGRGDGSQIEGRGAGLGCQRARAEICHGAARAHAARRSGCRREQHAQAAIESPSGCRGTDWEDRT
jgi:hypothetical protein